VFNMRRKLQHESVERFRNADDTNFTAIKSKLARVALDDAEKIREASPPLPDALGDRAQDNWEPLLAIASCASADWLARATAAALALTPRGEVQGGTGNELLADIREVAGRRERITSIELIELLIKDEEKAWVAYNRGSPINPRQLAKLLQVYGIRPRTVRMGPNKTPKGYYVADFADAFTRYLDERDKPAVEDDGY
jgi:putative DNA primase/helicase